MDTMLGAVRDLAETLRDSGLNAQRCTFLNDLATLQFKIEALRDQPSDKLNDRINEIVEHIAELEKRYSQPSGDSGSAKLPALRVGHQEW